MLRSIDLVYKDIKNNSLSTEEKKENKKYILSRFKYNFKEFHNYLKFFWRRRNVDEYYLKIFRVYIYCVYNINTMCGEQKLLKKIFK